MAYKVVKYFTDLQDNEHPYNVGDIFPRDGMDVSDERLAELSGDRNLQGVPLIAEEIPDAEEAPEEKPATKVKKRSKKENA